MPIEINQMMVRALQCFQSGNHDEAELILIKVLGTQPRNFDALHILGVLKGIKNQHHEALEFFRKALRVNSNDSFLNFNIAKAFSEIGEDEKALKFHSSATRLNPNHPEGWVSYGKSLSNLKRFDESLNLFSKALALNPEYAEAWTNQGCALKELGRHQEALDSFDKSLKVNPNFAETWSSRGIALLELKLVGEALASFDRAIEIKPDFAEVWNNRGNALNDLKRHEEALSSYARAIDLMPEYAEAWNNRGNVLNDLKRHEEALASHDRAIELMPDYKEAWNNRGNALNDLKRHEEALASYARAIDLMPEYAEAWSNSGTVLNDLKRHEEALASYIRAIELMPDYAQAWSNRGVALGDLKRHEEALICYERSIEIKPDYAEAIYNKGLLQLALKDFLGGFENCLRRWETKNFSGKTLNMGLPLCNRVMNEENILLWGEQGIGDEIFFAGMLTQALDRFSSVKLVADTRLHLTLSRSFPMVTLLKRGQHLKPEHLHKMDSHAPIGDLGHILKLDSDTIMSTRKPFLVADKAKSSNFQMLAPFSSGKIICGLAWKSKNDRFGQEKSICLEQLEPILKNTQFEFINLQYGEVDPEIQKVRSRFGVNIHQIEGVDIYNDIDSLLALIDACDIVVTTSNLTAHLAGSIGKKGCVFVPFSKGKIWYWHLDDADSFWYPSLKVFHQDVRNDWTDTILQAKTWINLDVL